MEAIKTLLNELTHRIEGNATQVVDFENKKNVILSIENILFKYGIDKQNMTGDSLSKLSDADFRSILFLMEDHSIDEQVDMFKTHAKVLELFNSVDASKQSVLNDSSRQSAMDFFNHITAEINDFLQNFTQKNKERIESLKQSTELPKFYLEFFNSNQLAKPMIQIEELEGFNNLLNTLGFDDNTKGQIKKHIGQSNYRLIVEPEKINATNQNIEIIEPYQGLLNRYRAEFGESLDLDLDNIDLSLENMSEITQKVSAEKRIDPYKVKRAVIIKIMEKLIKELEGGIPSEELNSYTDELNQIVEIANGLFMSEQDMSVIREIVRIIKSEKALIDSANKEELKELLNTNFILENDEKTVKYEIVALLIALQGKLESYQEFLKKYHANKEGLENEKNQIIFEINEIINSYKILKIKWIAYQTPEQKNQNVRLS